MGGGGVEDEDVVWKTTSIVVEGLIMAAKIVIIEDVVVVEVAPVDMTTIMDVVGGRAAILIDTMVLVVAMVDLHRVDTAEDPPATLQLQPPWLQSVFVIFSYCLSYLSLLRSLASG